MEKRQEKPEPSIRFRNSIVEGDLGAAQALFAEGGIDVDSLEDGLAALHLACIYDKVELVDLLLSCGADPNRRAHNRNLDGSMDREHDATPLICSRSVEVVRRLAQEKIDLNAVTGMGETALMMNCGRFDVVTTLLLISDEAQQAHVVSH